MFQDALQNRAHNGDQAALRDIYNRYSREVYAVSHTALGNADAARAVVKQVFLQLYRELMRGENDLDLPARLSALTNEEIRITRIAAGDLDPESLLVQYTIASQPAVDTSHTMERIRAHMQQPPAAQPTEEVPAPAEEPACADSFEQSFAEPAADPTEAELFDEPIAEPAAEPESEPAPAAATETCKASEENKPTEKVDTEEEQTDPFASEPTTRTTSARFGAVIAGIILFLLLIVFAWLIAGILMDLKILPFYDLGYSLFNEYVFDFFRLP